VALLIWWLVTRIAGLPAFILPSPLQVAVRFGKAFTDGSLLSNTLATLTEVVLGLLAGTVTAVVLGYFIAKSRLFERLVAPYLVATQAFDRCHCTIAGYLVWTGNIFKSTDLCADRFLPVLVNTVVGVRAVPRPLHDLMGSLYATPSQTLRYLELPAALPILLGGLRIGATLSVHWGSGSANWSAPIRVWASSSIVARGQYDTALVFVAVFTLILLALALYGIVAFVESKLCLARILMSVDMKKILRFLILVSFLLKCLCGKAPARSLTQVRLRWAISPTSNLPLFTWRSRKVIFRDAGIQVTFDYSMETDITALGGADQIQFGWFPAHSPAGARSGLPIRLCSSLVPAVSGLGGGEV